MLKLHVENLHPLQKESLEKAFTDRLAEGEQLMLAFRAPQFVLCFTSKRVLAFELQEQSLLIKKSITVPYHKIASFCAFAPSVIENSTSEVMIWVVDGGELHFAFAEAANILYIETILGTFVL